MLQIRLCCAVELTKALLVSLLQPLKMSDGWKLLKSGFVIIVGFDYDCKLTSVTSAIRQNVKFVSTLLKPQAGSHSSISCAHKNCSSIFPSCSNSPTPGLLDLVLGVCPWVDLHSFQLCWLPTCYYLDNTPTHTDSEAQTHHQVFFLSFFFLNPKSSAGPPANSTAIYSVNHQEVFFFIIALMGLNCSERKTRRGLKTSKFKILMI